MATIEEYNALLVDAEADLMFLDRRREELLSVLGWMRGRIDSLKPYPNGEEPPPQPPQAAADGRARGRQSPGSQETGLEAPEP